MSQTIEELIAQVDQGIHVVTGRLAIKSKLETDLKSSQQRLQRLRQSVAEIEEAALVISTVESVQQQELRTKVEQLISYGLSTIFHRSYTFVLKQEQRGNQTDTTFCVLSPETGDIPIPLKDAHGGGLVAVVSFLLQFIILVSTRPALSPIFFKDEPFTAVSEENRERLTDFIQKLAVSSSMQFVFVTHDPELAAIGDKAYRFKRVGGLTQVEFIQSGE